MKHISALRKAELIEAMLSSDDASDGQLAG
jgi:hypothetical protein